MTRIQKVTLLVTFLILFICPVHIFAENKILNIRHWAAPDHTRVVIDASDDIPYTIKKADKKVSIDFKNTDVPEDLPHELILKKPGIDKIMVIPLPQGTVRVELSIDKNVETKVFNIKKIQDKPERIVIDIEFPDVKKLERKEREEVKVLRKNKIIVIDPGHGGEDPGAVGKLRTQEKKVVLEISRKLKDILNKKGGYRAFLTRNGDYYVPFKKRMKIAREYGADLFLSVHADAFKRRSARGSSVYCLSLRGASSEAGKLLARNENLADIIGGSSNGENSDESDPIILNMFQTNTINSSKIFGSTVLKKLVEVNHIKYRQVQEAPFIVLKLPEVPSLLVETAYISNPREEKLLRSNQFQKEVAKAIASAITEFLTDQPMQQPSTSPEIVLTKIEDKQTPPETQDESDKSKIPSTAHTVVKPVPKKAVAEEKREEDVKTQATRLESLPSSPERAVTFYKVKKGDTLDKIARRHNTTISALLKLNNMKMKDPLYFGRMVKVSVPEKAVTEEKKEKDVKTQAPREESSSSSPAPAVTLYKVKKGDTLDKIAQRHNTTISALLKLNNMKMKEHLYVGRKLKVHTHADEGEVKKTVVVESKTYTYRVKEGDTLDKIARRCKTSISELRRLNQMKRADVLLVNQKLKLPSNPSL